MRCERQLFQCLCLIAMGFGPPAMGQNGPIVTIEGKNGNKVEVTSITPGDKFFVIEQMIYICPNVPYTFTLKPVAAEHWEVSNFSQPEPVSFTEDDGGQEKDIHSVDFVRFQDSVIENRENIPVVATVLKVDLEMQGLPEEDKPPPNEENPGATICVNNDDDDASKTQDKDQAGPIVGEDDLVAVQLSLLPSNLTKGTLKLEAATGATKIRMWEKPTKGVKPVDLPKIWNIGSETPPTTLYVEPVPKAVFRGKNG